MANYDRRILVPYLQDVCSMELLCSKLLREISDVKYEIKQINAKINKQLYEPQKPLRKNYKKSSAGGIVAIILFCIVPLWFGIDGIINGAGWLGNFLLLAFAAFWGFIFIATNLGDEIEADKKFKTDLNSYNQVCLENQRHKQQVPTLKRQKQNKEYHLHTLESRLNSALSICKELYDVNIIPSRYRNIHAAYYLYDFFSTSKETDLEKVIQTMLLDEIIQKLDRIIAQNEQILLNQRISIALQTQNNKQMADNHHQQMQAIARMEQNQELQIDYQKMIAENQIVTNFLLAADYLYKD